MKEFFKTSILLASLTGLLIAIGYLIGGFDGMILFFGISVVMNFVSFWFSDRIAISMSGGKEVDPNELPNLFSSTQELASRMGIPMPKLYISPQMQPNAFATGRSPSRSAICVTQGLLANLERDEVKAVIAHELAHIKNRDTLTSTIAAVIAGLISNIGSFFLWFGGNDENRNPIAAIALIIVAPIAAAIIQFAISRSREFAADAEAAKAIGSGRSLADALIKIEDIATHAPMQVNQAMASLYIGNPFGKAASGISQLFSTHPPTAERVDRLLQM